MPSRPHIALIPAVLLHGDAPSPDQGIVAETLNLAGLEGYATGGTVHVVINNQIGFTTSPTEARSSNLRDGRGQRWSRPRSSTSTATTRRRCGHVAALSFEYRQRYKRDVVIDMFGYRRWGHNETDEPSYTQPLMYAKIKNHTPVGQLYGEHLVRTGVITREELDRLWTEKKARCSARGRRARSPRSRAARRSRPRPSTLRDVGAAAHHAQGAQHRSRGFEIHPKLMPFLRRRAELLEGKGEVDWATAESLAWGTLLLEGVPVRLSGQDSGRGTFSQRHAVFYDVRTGKEYAPCRPWPRPEWASRCMTACSRKRR